MAEISAAGGDSRGIDRSEIREAVANWALWRDSGRFNELRALYTADAVVHTTWFVGSATEFLERSSKGGGRSQHFVGAISVELNGGRAIAEARAILLVRAMLQGVEVDVTCYLRFYDWFVRQGGRWLIQRRNGIYEKDRLDPVDPAKTIALDPAELARYPAGYRHIAYVQASGGAKITPNLPTPGSPELARLYEEGTTWLNQA